MKRGVYPVKHWREGFLKPVTSQRSAVSSASCEQELKRRIFVTAILTAVLETARCVRHTVKSTAEKAMKAQRGNLRYFGRTILGLYYIDITTQL